MSEQSHWAQELFVRTSANFDEQIAEGAVFLHGFAADIADDISSEVDLIARAAPFRHLSTPGGHKMSVAMTNCGRTGWVSDESGYRYDTVDPRSLRPWPAMPRSWRRLAVAAAERAGYRGFDPEACLVNRYEPGARMSLHQDRDEADLDAPIVSVSLGLPATFVFGGLDRSDAVQRMRMEHGDVIVWGGPSRLAFHGVSPLTTGSHAVTGALRYNLTFRKVSPDA